MLCPPDGATALCHTVGFSEIDKYASAVLKWHWPNIKNWGDITNINPEELPDFDLITFGFPCQTFSIAGKRKGFEDLRGQLIYEVIRILKVKQPKWFIGENVKGLLSHNKGQTIEIILEELCAAGYAIDFDVLNAKDFGIPQNRERVFIVGKRLDTLKPEEII
jgi:DNA (cytosine-5)-methyltransferase 1